MSNIYYQPRVLNDKGEYVLPKELFSIEVFVSMEEARKFLAGLGYQPDDAQYAEYTDGDMEFMKVIFSDLSLARGCEESTSTLEARVCAECQQETILTMAEQYITNRDEYRQFLLACLGYSIE